MKFNKKETRLVVTTRNLSKIADAIEKGFETFNSLKPVSHSLNDIERAIGNIAIDKVANDARSLMKTLRSISAMLVSGVTAEDPDMVGTTMTARDEIYTLIDHIGDSIREAGERFRVGSAAIQKIDSSLMDMANNSHSFDGDVDSELEYTGKKLVSVNGVKDFFEANRRGIGTIGNSIDDIAKILREAGIAHHNFDTIVELIGENIVEANDMIEELYSLVDSIRITSMEVSFTYRIHCFDAMDDISSAFTDMVASAPSA